MAILIKPGLKNNLVKPSNKAVTPVVRAKGFIELLGRSNFSFLRGASSPEEMVTEAIHHDYDGIAMCDLNGLYGVARGYSLLQAPSGLTTQVKAKEGFHYLVGSELTLTDETAITLLPINKQGYSHLCEILTLGKRQAGKGFSALHLHQIEKYNQDLLCFAIPPINEERFKSLHEIFGDRLYIPVWRDLTWESHEFCKQAFALEEKLNAQLFVTQRPFMHTPDRKPLFDILTCILHHTTLEEARDKLIQNGERALHSIEHLSYVWSDRLDLVEKTVDIAARSKFSLKELRYQYPRSNIPDNLTPAEYLRKLTEEGQKWRFPEGTPPRIQAIIEKELTLISRMKYEDYFITLREICQFADKKKILYQGRGSAANSVVCFCLGLTSVNPNAIDVLFERFISEERHEPPDIDIDFEHSRREEVIQHIYQKYDERHAAMVCTVIRYRSRMAIRETAKVFGIPLATINEMVKYMGRDGMRRLVEPDAAARFGVDPARWTLMLAMAQQVHGFPRHLGIHTGGFLITQDSITEMVPVEKATMNGRYVIQWNKDDVAALGLMKIDVLSLGMLTCLRKCFDLLKKHKNKDYNLATIPQDHVPTYDMICEADTVGVFQIESRAQMQTLPRMQPRKFYDLVVEVAIVRPGPLQGGMVHPYLKRRQGLEKVTYPSKLLEPILNKTHGVPIFQEQVMQIVIAAAGFTPGQADELRRIMSSAWRKKSSMDAIRDKILIGFQSKGISAEYAEQIYKTIEGFANYGFPESHAASFALLTYASCYIKKEYPDVFACSLLNSQPMGFYAPRTLVAEAQRHDVTVLPLCVQNSDYDYTLHDHGNRYLDLRVGLRSLYGMPEELARKIEDERKLNGAYADLSDFIRRTSLPRAILVKLAASGAMECFNTNARELIWHLESLSLDQSSFLWGKPKEALVQQEFDDDDSDNLPFESNWDRMQREYDSKGYSVDSHPMSVLRSYLKMKNAEFIKQRYVPFATSADLKNFPHKRKVRLAGLVSVTQRPPTAKGMCFITLEDEFGFMNIVIHPDVYQKDRMAIYGKSLLEIQGQVEKVGKLINIRAERVLPLQ
ncbi:DNA polymerase III subunit alpha [Bdellovibrio sp. NC01]|uniref:DNA polymerase III subunit alpha n=1 Tax=Bdellovibrio sp. NC01 TaxID=2220073 RepID=UPI00115B3D9C|nr:error-prone DNA polymerase [Bdellovibrio sp. NC01]QDK36468.1 error-prone DNA polymerase [Bdellovibrio sp. NC01]